MPREVHPSESPFGRLARLERQCEEPCDAWHHVIPWRRNEWKFIAATHATSGWGENSTLDYCQPIWNDNDVDDQVSDESQHWEGYNHGNQWEDYGQRPAEDENQTGPWYHEDYYQPISNDYDLDDQVSDGSQNWEGYNHANQWDDYGQRPTEDDDMRGPWYHEDYYQTNSNDSDVDDQVSDGSQNWEGYNHANHWDDYGQRPTEDDDMTGPWYHDQKDDMTQQWPSDWDYGYHLADQWHDHDECQLNHTPDDKRPWVDTYPQPTTYSPLPNGTNEDYEDVCDKDGLKQPSCSYPQPNRTGEDSDDDWGNWSRDGLKPWNQDNTTSGEQNDADPDGHMMPNSDLCIVVTEQEWQSMLHGARLLLRPYKGNVHSELALATRIKDEYCVVGSCTVDGCCEDKPGDRTTNHILKDIYPQKNLRSLRQNSKLLWVWKLGDMCPVPEPLEIPWISSKGRNRPFKIDVSQLKHPSKTAICRDHCPSSLS
eukprot:s2993_g10.t1